MKRTTKVTQSPKKMEIAGSKSDPLGHLRRRHVGLGDEPISAELAGLLELRRNYTNKGDHQETSSYEIQS
jgi:hypothetical protein